MISLLDINHIVNKLGCKKWKYVFTASKSLEMVIIQRFIDGRFRVVIKSRGPGIFPGY